MQEVKVELPEPRRIKAKDVFLSYLLEHHAGEIVHLLRQPASGSGMAIQISVLPLMQHHVEVAEALLSRPDRLLPVLSSAAVEAQKRLHQTLQAQLDKETLSEDEQAFLSAHQMALTDVKSFSVKEDVHPRLVGVPCPAETRVPRSADVGLLLCFAGTVVRATAPRLLRHTLVYTCDTCGHLIHVKADHDLYYSASKPQHCTNPDIKCYSKNFSSAVLPEAAHTSDYQEVKLQELMSGGGGGGGNSIPQSIWVTLHHDLVDSCKPGDDVLVCGSIVRRWKPVSKDARPAIEVVIKANNITVRNKQEGNACLKPEQEEEFEQFWQQHQHKPLVARDILLASVCPQIYGLYLVKLAVAMVMCGGVQRVDRGGSRVRGEPHLLLVGDPGTGKSQLLQWACNASSRAVLTTGVGSTAAGLTVAAVREPGGDWGLEAGALVLADGGVCCIDEFSSVREADRAAIHEAMEQQTISVAKAGMVCKLNCRCSVVAATNPKGRYDPTEPLNLNVGVASPLLSRFDLILVLLDTNNPSWDQLVSNYILSGGALGCLPTTAPEEASTDALWSLDKMRAYFRYARRLQPRVSASADAVLSRFYQMQRNCRDRDQSRTTIRLLESLVRLSQGHARLMLRKVVTTLDAVVAVGLWEAAMAPPSAVYGIFDQQPHGGNAALHAGFPLDPTLNYKQQAQTVLHRLGLEEELRQELARLDEAESQSSAEHLAAILATNSSSATVNQDPVPIFRVPSTIAPSARSLSTDPGPLREVLTCTQGRRPLPFLSCATQDSRRKDLIEELEEVPPMVPEITKRKSNARRGKKSCSKKTTTVSIEKYLTRAATQQREKLRIVKPAKKKKNLFIISSESESSSSEATDSDVPAAASAEVSQSNKSHSMVSASETVDNEGKKGEAPTDSDQSSNSGHLPEKFVNADDNEPTTTPTGSSKNIAPSPTFVIGTTSKLGKENRQLSLIHNAKNVQVPTNSPIFTTSSLSKKISAKRKQLSDSPSFCINTTVKKARVLKQAGRQPTCSSKGGSHNDREAVNGSLDTTKKGKIRNKIKYKNIMCVETPRNIPDEDRENCREMPKDTPDDNQNSRKTLNESIDDDTVRETSKETNAVVDPGSTAKICGTASGVESTVEDENFTVSQKARSFLKKYAFSHEASAKIRKNPTADSNTVAREEEFEPVGEPPFLEERPLEGPIRVTNKCSFNRDFNLDLSGFSDEPANTADESISLSDTASASLFSTTSVLPETSPSLASKFKRFAFTPKEPQDGESSIIEEKQTLKISHKEAPQHGVTKSCGIKHLKVGYGTLRTDNISPSDTLNAICKTDIGCKLLSRSAKVVPDDVSSTEKCIENIETNRPDKDIALVSNGRSCFDLGSVGAVEKILPLKTPFSVEKSFEKFASSQDLDDFEF